MIIGVENDFSETEFAAIGKLVWSFTVLEHELARAAMSLRVEAATLSQSKPETIIDLQVLRIIKGTLNNRFEAFIAALRAAKPSPETDEWATEAEQKFKEGLIWRNRVCHGNWQRREGQMTVRFFDRELLENEYDVPHIPITVQELGDLCETTLKWAIEIAIKSGTVEK